MSVEEIVRLISLNISLLISIVGFVIALIKAIKGKKWDELRDVINNFLIQAENIQNYTGAEKKNAVLQWTQEFCKKNGIAFDQTKVDKLIEDLINLTNNVNCNKEVKKDSQQDESKE